MCRWLFLKMEDGEDTLKNILLKDIEYPETDTETSPADSDNRTSDATDEFGSDDSYLGGTDDFGGGEEMETSTEDIGAAE